jgi:hypothetical protein
VVVQVISASRSEWIVPFTGLQLGQFRKLVATVAVRGGDAVADGVESVVAGPVLLMATDWRTNLTMRQIGPPFGVGHDDARVALWASASAAARGYSVEQRG